MNKKQFNVKQYRQRNVVVYGQNIRHAKATNRFIQQVINDAIVIPTSINVSSNNGFAIAIPSEGTKTLQFTATVLPAGSDQTVMYELVGTPDGITLTSNGLLSITPNAEVGTISFVTTSTFDPSVTKLTNVELLPIGATAVNITTKPEYIEMGGTGQFVASVDPANANQGITWSINPSVNGVSINQSGLVNVSVDATELESVTVVATSNVTSTISDSAIFTIVRPNAESVVVSPTTQNITQPTTGTATANYSAIVNPSLANQTVTWSINPAVTGATISQTGVLTISSTTPIGSITLRATSTNEPSIGFNASAVVVQPVATSVNITPNSGNTLIQPTTGTVTKDFNATVSPTNANQTVTWSINPAVTGATINSSGLLSIGTTTPAGILNVIATSTTAGVNNTMPVTVTIPEPVSLSISPNTGNTMIIPASGTIDRTFSSTVTPSNAPQGVTWSLSKAVVGVTISATGVLTISSTTPVDSFNVVATSTTLGTVTNTMAITTALPDPTALTVSTTGGNNITQPTTGTFTKQYSVSGSTPTNAIKNVTWSVSPATTGVSINGSGLLTISSNTPAETFNVIATSTVANGVTGQLSANVVLPTPSSIILTPLTFDAIAPETDIATQQFTASVVPTNANQGITWTMSKSVPNVTLSTTGLLTISEGALTDTFNVIATSSVASGVKSESVVNITEFTVPEE